MRGVVENTFGFVGSKLQAPDPENHQDQTVAKDERTYFVDANSQPSRHVFHRYSSDPKTGVARHDATTFARTRCNPVAPSGT